MQSSELKLDLFRYIDKLGDKQLLQIHKYLINSNKVRDNDFWSTLSEWQKKDIELGLTDLDRGNKSSFDEVIAKY
jgi:hypothetical protein